MRSVAAILIVLLLAGCSTSAPPPTTGDVPAATFATAIDVSGARGGPEPVVRIADDGTIYLAAQDSGGGVPHFWVSIDGGKTFAASSPSTATGGEVDLAAGAGGAVFVTQLGTGGNVISVSRDHGATWTPSLLGATQYFDREWAAAFGSFYIVARDFQKSTSVASRSDDGGVTFQPKGSPWDGAHEPGDSTGPLVATASGLVMPYACRNFKAVCLAASDDSAATWTQHLVATRTADVDNVYPSAAAAGSRVVVTWSDASSGRVAVYAATSNDRGATWSKPALASGADETATLAWIATGGGAWWIVYVSTPGAYASADAADKAPWSAMAVKIDPASLQAAQRGRVIPEPVHEGVISRPVGRPGHSGPVNRDFGDFFTVAVRPDGHPLVALVKTVGGASRDLLVSGT